MEAEQVLSEVASELGALQMTLADACRAHAKRKTLLPADLRLVERLQGRIPGKDLAARACHSFLFRNGLTTPKKKKKSSQK